MVSGSTFLDGGAGEVGQALNVLILYENLAAGRRAMRLCCDLACQQDGDFSFQPRLWRLDVVADSLGGGFAIADAVHTDLVIVSASGQTEVSRRAQHWLKLCLAVAQKCGNCVAMIALLDAEGQFNDACFSNLQFLRSLAREAGVEFFVPFANRKEDLRARPTGASPTPILLDQGGAAAEWPYARMGLHD